MQRKESSNSVEVNPSDNMPLEDAGAADPREELKEQPVELGQGLERARKLLQKST